MAIVTKVNERRKKIMMTNVEYVTAILNASDALFQSTYDKEKEADFEDMTTQKGN